MEGTVISNGLKWIIGIALTISMSAVGYTLKRDMDTNTKIVTLQTQVIQAQDELIDLWKLVNKNTDEKEKWLIVITEMKGDITLLKHNIEELR